MNSAPIVDRIRIIPRPSDFLDRNVGSSGEVFYDKASNTLRLYSGKEQGGYEVITEDNVEHILSEQNIASVIYNVVIENIGEGNKYILNGDYKPVLNFVVGYTYVFNQDDNTNVYYPNENGTVNNQHPLNFSADNLNGDIGGGTTYLDNVTYKLDNKVVTKEEYWAKFESSTQRSVQIRVTNNTPSRLYYWCQNHLNMGDAINIANPGSGGSSSGASVDVSDTAPTSPAPGNLWLNTESGKLYIYVNDGDSNQWIQPASPTGEVAADGGVSTDAETLDGQTPAYYLDYTNFTNVPVLGLLDLGISDGLNGQVLTTNGAGAFSFATVSGGGSADLSGSVLSDLSNVSSTSPTDGQALVWDNSNSTWTPGTVSGSGSLSNIVEDSSPQLGGSLDGSNNVIANVAAPSVTAANTFNSLYGTSITQDDIVVTKGYVDTAISGVSITETDTLASVTGRGATTNTALTINNTLTVDSIITTNTGTPEINSATSFQVTAPDGMTVNGVPTPVIGGYVTLGATPTWTGSPGISGVTQDASGDYTVTFSSAYLSASDYQVVATINDYTNSTGVYIPITRSTSNFNMILYREGDGTAVDAGDVVILVYEF